MTAIGAAHRGLIVYSDYLMRHTRLPLVWILTGALLLLMSGCGGNSSRYHLSQDRGPEDSSFNPHSVAEPTPRVEPKSRGGNKSPYQVWGKTYYVMDNANGYVAEGIASWYGKKFHGYKTSNGETYDMYGFTAAHRSLPLPTYARITNLANGAQVVVRVNDRGPFHSDRIIDLSYAAAKKLGYVNKGTARVRIEAYPYKSDSTIADQIESTVPPSSTSSAPAGAEGFFLQVGAFSNEIAAIRTLNRVSALLDAPVFVSKGESGTPVYRVRVGPFSGEREARRFLDILQRAAYPDALLIKRPLAEANS
ncbi:septal ring lytic transglycosylase RlpA family protein [Hahella ganghwensis]|uniref:septal ring lytic transglycosylase RlpA family protein n=1 Tax=Hahella ganghwensis TaxID=286420 RepID=UPI000373F007|nr:septal ring lytic transglycosylase RlpA family protein [Hahella ganghwensis]